MPKKDSSVPEKIMYKHEIFLMHGNENDMEPILSFVSGTPEVCAYSLGQKIHSKGTDYEIFMKCKDGSHIKYCAK